MILTQTCIDKLLPKGLLSKTTLLVLAEPEAQLKDLQLWADQAIVGLKEGLNEVREPGAIDWPKGDGPLVFFSEIIQSLNPTPQLPGREGRPHKTCLEQAVFLGAARVLYGSAKDAKDAGVEASAEVVLRFVSKLGKTHIELVRNDFNPKQKGTVLPFYFGPAPDTTPATMWDILNDDDEDDED